MKTEPNTTSKSGRTVFRVMLDSMIEARMRQARRYAAGAISMIDADQTIGRR